MEEKVRRGFLYVAGFVLLSMSSGMAWQFAQDPSRFDSDLARISGGDPYAALFIIVGPFVYGAICFVLAMAPPAQSRPLPQLKRIKPLPLR